MTTDQSLLNESRLMLERWVSYYDKQGHSTDLLKDTKSLVARIEEDKPRFEYVGMERPTDQSRVLCVLGYSPTGKCESIDTGKYFALAGYKIVNGAKFKDESLALAWKNELPKPEAPRYLPTDDEVARMERNGEG